MLSAFISKSTSATTVGFFVFLVGFVTQVRFLSCKKQIAGTVSSN